MAKKKSNKRIEKKRTQQSQRANLQKSGMTSKEAKQIKGTELKKASAKIEQQQKYNENRAYLLSLGIDKSIISKNRLYRRSDKFLNDKENIKKWRKETRELNRYKRLIDAGYKKDEIKKSWLRYDKITDTMVFERLQYKVHYNKKYLGIMYAELYADEMFIEDLSSMSFYDLLQEVKDLIASANDDPDNSDGFRGVFKFIVGRDKSDVEHACNIWSSRGYNVSIGKFSKESYSTLFVRNDFSLREYLETMYFVFSHQKSEDVLTTYKEFYKYALNFDDFKVFEKLFPYSL